MGAPQSLLGGPLEPFEGDPLPPLARQQQETLQAGDYLSLRSHLLAAEPAAAAAAAAIL